MTLLPSTTHTLPPVNLPEALRRLGLSPSDTLTTELANLAAPLLGIEVVTGGALIDRVTQHTKLPRLVHAALAERFPDLILTPGRVQGRAMTPVEVRLQRLLGNISPQLQAEGLALHDLRRRLAGKYGTTSRADEVAGSLRAMGWVRVRDWRDLEGGFRALWHPPGSPAAMHELARHKRSPNGTRKASPPIGQPAQRLNRGPTQA